MKAGARLEARGTRILDRAVRYILIIWILNLGFAPCSFGADKWSGVDESVVEKIASEHGRESRAPLINTDQGDLLLFVFLLAGAAGGFAAGYYWRVLMEGRGRQG